MTFTKEQLIEKLQHRISVASGFPGSEKAQMDLELARIALASLEAEAVAYMHRSGQVVTREECCDDKTFAICCKVETPLYTIPPAPVSVPEFAPIAYIFKHPAGRLFWSMTDESNKGQSDVMPVYSAPVPAFVPPAIEPDYEVIKGILPTANPDEYACCIAADMWNACRAAMLQVSEPVTTAYKLPDDFDFDRFNDVTWLEAVASNPHMHSLTTSTIAMVALELNKRLETGNSPVIPDCSCGTCRPVTFTDSRFVVCSECGNKRCPHANDHRHACTGSNEPGQEGSAYPAAPQQEISHALAKGMERYGDAMQELAKKEVK